MRSATSSSATSHSASAARFASVDFVARLGGDEFLVVVADVKDPARLVGFGQRMIQEIEQPYTIGDQLFAVSASVGATMVETGDEPLSVIERADAAVYQAKRRGRRRVEMFDKELQRSIEHQAELELALRQAIQHGELRMYLQPLADLDTGLPSGAEALVRWERPGVGLVSPNDFIPIAERSGLIFELERWMLEAACRRIAEWRLLGQGEGMRLAVNISGRHLIEGNLIADLDDAIAATGADPNLLEIELTESQLLDDVGRASSVLAGVRDRGVKVAIDDFGTGYSSMTYLQKLPVDIVKIDRSFISSATTNDFDSTIVDTVVTLARTLDLEVVAEGIETVEQLAYVINAGVSLGQGYLLARPVPAHEAEAVIFNGAAVRPRPGAGAGSQQRAVDQSAAGRRIDRHRLSAVGARGQSTGIQVSDSCTTLTSFASSPTSIVVESLASSIHFASISNTSSASSASSSSRSATSRPSLFSAASTRSPAALVWPRRRAAVPAVPSSPPSIPPFDLLPPSSPPRTDPAVDSSSELRLLVGLFLQHIDLVLHPVDLIPKTLGPRLVLVAQLGDFGLGAIVGELQATRFERVGVLSGPPVQLEFLVAVDLDGRGPHQFAADGLVERCPERLVRHFGLREPVHRRLGCGGPEVAVVVVDLHHP